MYSEIEYDNDFEYRDLTITDNKQTKINIKQNFSLTYERDEFERILKKESEVLCLFVLGFFYSI